MYTRNVSPYDGGVFHQVRKNPGIEGALKIVRLDLMNVFFS